MRCAKPGHRGSPDCAPIKSRENCNLSALFKETGRPTGGPWGRSEAPPSPSRRTLAICRLLLPTALKSRSACSARPPNSASTRSPSTPRRTSSAAPLQGRRGLPGRPRRGSPARPLESYLSIDEVIRAAMRPAPTRSTRATAWLSESPEFAEALRRRRDHLHRPAPRHHARTLGNKVSARNLASPAARR